MKTKLNLTLRLVLGNTLAILAVVGSYGYLNTQRISSIFDTEVKRETKLRMEEVRQRGLAEAKRIATNTAFALSNNDFGFLQNSLDPLVRADSGLAFTFLLDHNHDLVAKASRKGIEITSAMVSGEQQSSGGNEVRETHQGAIRLLEVSVPIQSGERTWGRVVLGYSLERLTQQLLALSRWKDSEVQRTMTATIIFAVILSVIGIVATVTLSMSVTRPIVTLTHAAERLANGELGLTVEVKDRGEIGVLGKTFNQMSNQLAKLIDEVKNKAALEKELEVAETVQATLIPPPTIHEVDDLRITGRYIPASRCGGDWWSFFPVSEHETLMLVGDVTGHGVPTTLITASVNACCEELQHTTEEMSSLCRTTDITLRDYLERRGSLSYLLEHLNRSICRVGHGQFFMTFSAALINSQTNELTYANAGHEAPLVISGDNGAEVEPLHSGPSRRLGEVAHARFEQSTHALCPGDTMVWYTDGLIEITNSRHRPFGDGRLVRTLRKHRDERVDVLAENVLDDVRAFAQDTPAADDITLVVVRRSPS